MRYRSQLYLQNTSAATYNYFPSIQLIYSGEGHRPVRPKIAQKRTNETHMQKFEMAVRDLRLIESREQWVGFATPDPEIQTASSIRQRGVLRESKWTFISVRFFFLLLTKANKL